MGFSLYKVERVTYSNIVEPRFFVRCTDYPYSKDAAFSLDCHKRVQIERLVLFVHKVLYLPMSSSIMKTFELGLGSSTLRLLTGE